MENVQKTEIRRRIALAIMQIAAIVIVGACLLMTLQQLFPNEFNFKLPEGQNKLTFDSAIYFVVITIATVGYGDICPTSILSRFLIGILFLVALLILTMQTTELSQLFKVDIIYIYIYRIRNYTVNNITKCIQHI